MHTHHFKTLLAASLVCLLQCRPLREISPDTAERIDVVEHGENTDARMTAMDELIAEGDSTGYARLVDALVRMVEEEDDSRRRIFPYGQAPQRGSTDLLFDRFIETARSRCANDPNARADAIRFAEALVASKSRRIPGRMRLDAFEVILACCASDEEKLARTVDWVNRDVHWLRYYMEVSLRKKGLFTEDLIARVRPIARQSLANNAVNRTALILSAEGADAAILPDLRDAIARGKLSKDDLYDARRAVWKIEMQNPPGRLLEFLENAQQDHWAVWYQDGTAWIVRKAAERGLPREDIREAVRQYYAKCEEETLYQMRAMGLDREVVRLELLEKNELPERDRDAFLRR
ncbi:MAG: hypothetical protein JXB13_20640 [Phycisphaerae bacterium]|nr:hypothetical protein [Phycisphaerae bacterium]